MGDENRIVGIAEIAVASSPQRLMALGLGSCIGVTLYDAEAKVGGMAHVMLPSSKLHSAEALPGKYADTALVALAAELEKAGGGREKLEAKIVGGANMFADISTNISVPIGLRNVTAVRSKLSEMGISIVGEEVGGNRGRTIIFNLNDGRVEIRKLNQPAQYL
jgi:chemotaxis protein CheD